MLEETGHERKNEPGARLPENGAKDPIGYLRERAEASALGEDALRNRLASHAIPFGALTSGDYEGFRLRRAEIFEGAIATLCNGDDWAPSGLA